jgi:uncharacterized membrane protein YvbJ
MICEDCGCENPDDAKFCKNCGKAFAKPNTPARTADERQNKKKIDNGTLYDWILPILYWHDKRTDEYKLSKTKIISILVFIYFFYQNYFTWNSVYQFNTPLHLAILWSLMSTIPIFLIGYVIHYLLNR